MDLLKKLFNNIKSNIKKFIYNKKIIHKKWQKIF